MQRAVDIVGRLNNVQAVSLAKRLHEVLYRAVPFASVEANLIAGVDELQAIRTLDASKRKQRMDPAASVAAARQVLMMFARDEDLAPVLVDVWDGIKADDALFVEAILAVGLVVNLTLFMATSEMEFAIGKLKVRKKAADAALLKELIAPVTELAKKG